MADEATAVQPNESAGRPMEQTHPTSLPGDERPPHSFPLFELPAEIWIRIVKAAVEREAEIKLPNRIDNPRPLAAVVQQPAITRTCRIIRRETLAHFYSCNTFVYLDHGSDANPLMRWLRLLKHADWGRQCNVVMKTRFPGARGFFEERLKQKCLPFRCRYVQVSEEIDEDGAKIEMLQYRIEGLWP